MTPQEKLILWRKSITTSEVCPRCSKGKIVRFAKGFFCDNHKDECKYGVSPNKETKYPGAAVGISGGRPEMRGHEKDYGIQEDNI